MHVENCSMLICPTMSRVHDYLTMLSFLRMRRFRYWRMGGNQQPYINSPFNPQTMHKIFREFIRLTFRSSWNTRKSEKVRKILRSLWVKKNKKCNRSTFYSPIVSAGKKIQFSTFIWKPLDLTKKSGKTKLFFTTWLVNEYWFPQNC